MMTPRPTAQPALLALAAGLLLSCGGDEPSPSTGDTSGDDRPSADDTSGGDTSGADDTGDTSGGDTSGGDTSGVDTSAPAEPIAIAPSDPALRYVGRWSFADPERPEVGWQGASVSLRFVGTALSAEIDAGSSEEYMRVVIDGDHAGSLRFAAARGEGTYAIAEGLEAGEHTVELIKETYAGQGFSLGGLTATGWSLLDPPAAPTRRIAFYGDSNLAGYSLMSEKNEGAWSLVGSHFTYAGVTARAFGADYHNVSTSGETLSGMTGRYDRWDRDESGASWDFEQFQPDVVVMNLGANDIYGASEQTVRGRYVRMLDLLRAAHPDAHIVVYNAWGWDYDEPADYTWEVVEDYGDPDVSVATFPWVFEQWHGCESDHAGMAQYLIAHLEATLGWSAGEQDVASGYGEGGGLANGGFESIAPFGGYAWRYYTDAGVERVEDAAGAHEGGAFLRLSEGAEVHQPNPAQGGQVVSVRLWIRGASGGEQAAITLDFRDQQMWSSPLQSETTTLKLTDEWAEYVVSAVAPEGGARPVFHTRLTLRADAGEVSFDGLEMTTE